MSGEAEKESAPLEVLQVARVPTGDPHAPTWLIEGLWATQSVGLIGGAPKCCKSWLALEMALSVASGRPCLGRFEALDTGPVLLYAAEDAPRQVRARLEGLAAAIQKKRPKLLVLDPFVRLHRLDENSAAEVSSVLQDLRAWQREYGVAILLVHHTRKSNGESGGQALRGSSDLHAWGDSNLYVRNSGEDITLSMEHRWARSGEPLTLRLVEGDGVPRLEIQPSATLLDR